MSKPILLDIMQGDTFIMQMRYDKHGFPEMIDGEVVEVHRAEDIEEFVYSKRPSLRGKNIRIETTDQRVYP
jgi:hypothetical protein